MMYRIIWHSNAQNYEGESDILYSSREQAEEAAARADRYVPEHSHTVRGE